MVLELMTHTSGIRPSISRIRTDLLISETIAIENASSAYERLILHSVSIIYTLIFILPALILYHRVL